jgi:hypothetical protein
MNTVILSGPASAISKSDAKYMALMDTDTRNLVCTVMWAPNINRNLQLKLNNNLGRIDVFAAAITFLSSVLKQHKDVPVLAIDGDALVLALALGAGYLSTNTELTELMAGMSFVVEASVANANGVTSNSVRFVGMNIQGIKQLATATDLVLTVTMK